VSRQRFPACVPPEHVPPVVSVPVHDPPGQVSAMALAQVAEQAFELVLVPVASRGTKPRPTRSSFSVLLPSFAEAVAQPTSAESIVPSPSLSLPSLHWDAREGVAASCSPTSSSTRDTHLPRVIGDSWLPFPTFDPNSSHHGRTTGFDPPESPIGPSR